MRSVLVGVLSLTLAACGLTETATTAAVAGKTQADQIEQARSAEQKVLNGLEQAQQQADQRLKDAEAK